MARRFAASALCLGNAALIAGCAGDAPAEQVGSIKQAYWCGGPIPSDVYTPFPEPAFYPSGPVGPNFPWRGTTAEVNPGYPYPDGKEDFEAYMNLPITIECDNNKAARSYVDVTKGCLDAVLISGTLYKRGRIELTPTEPGFRALALGHTSSDQAHPIKWTDQMIEYRFNQIGDFLAGAPDTAGFHIVARYRTENDHYVASWRKDGKVTIKEKLCGVYTQLAVADLGTWAPATWHRLRFDAVGQNLKFYVDNVLRLEVTDGTFSWGTGGIRVDYAQAYLDDWAVSEAPSYDQTILSDVPRAFWAVNKAPGTEPDLTGNGNTGTYQGGTPSLMTMPNGNQAARFNGSSQYLTIPSNTSFSIPTTGNLTWEGWIRPDVLEFPNEAPDGYVDWLGKCANYSPTCEWEARMYSTTTLEEGRCNRLSAYAFNPGGNLGSGADWQPTCGLIQAGQWYHIVGEYTTQSQPSACASAFPGSINIWVNGVKWDQPSHHPTGCMSQFKVVPQANNSPLTIGTMALDTWFEGAIGKVAIYDYLLSQTQITNHYRAMTGQVPAGQCADTCSF